MRARVQEGLSDLEVLENELSESFTTLKMRSERLAFSFRRLGEEKRSKRVHFCAHELGFGHSEGAYKLHDADFCRERLCPMCAARRTRKTFAQVYQITSKLRDDGVQFLFLTLTVPNCTGAALKATIDRLQKAFHKFVNYKRFKGSVLGFFRALEITRNNRSRSKFYGTFHPHFHVILAVPADYFTSSSYIQRDDFLKMWRKAYKDDSITQVDVRKVKNVSGDGIDDLAKACAEVAKYTVKSKDYIFRNDDDLTDEVVSVLMGALKGRRLTAFGGCFAVVRDLLGLDDNEDGDLVHTETETKSADSVAMRRYKWKHIQHSYVLISERTEIFLSGVGWISEETYLKINGLDLTEWKAQVNLFEGDRKRSYRELLSS